MQRSANDGLPLRFRGPDLAVGFCKVSGVQAVKVSVAEHHFVCEASCVNRQRSCDHKVPRRRARFAAGLRGSACSLVNACLPIRAGGVRRCVGGQTSDSASLHRGPSFGAAIEESVGAKNPCQILQSPARGSLTTRSTGRGKGQALVSCIGSRAGHRGR